MANLGEKVARLHAVAIAAIGVVILLIPSNKFHYVEECSWCHLTKTHEVPYHVWIQLNGKYKCSGTVVHHRYVLTPAECVDNSLSTSAFKVVSSTNTLNKGKSHDVDKIIVHPLYAHKRFDRHNVALLRLEKKLQVVGGREAVIPLSKTKPRRNLLLFATGFGIGSLGIDISKYDRILFEQHKFQMIIVTKQECENSFPNADLSGMFCAISPDPCLSDIGSPATINEERLIGIYIGNKDCTAPKPELFIDVTNHADFIRSIITPDYH